MKTLTIAIALMASSALSLPALAEGTGMKTDGQSTSAADEMRTKAQAQSDMQVHSSGDQEKAAGMMGGGEAAGLSGKNLSGEEIREIQQALKDAGTDIDVDGTWSDSTAQALESYQKGKGLTPSGELDQHTLSSLGVDVEMSGAQQAEMPEVQPEGPLGREPAMRPSGSDMMEDGQSAQ